MINITVNQALTFYAQLTKCLTNTNGYGGDTAEIYVYTLMEHSPSYASNRESTFAQEDVKQAIDALLRLCARFIADQDCD